MIKFKKLDITSFKGIFHCILDFEHLEGKLYSLEGINNTNEFAASNGAGKSTLTEALCFALYGSTTDSSIKKADYQNKNTKIKLKLVLDLDIQNVSYTIERTDKEFKLYKDGEDISELTKTDTEKKFWEILQLTKAEFCSFTYLAQNGGGSFLTKTPAEKLSCIKDFIFGEDLLLMQDKIANLLNEVKTTINTTEKECANLEGSIESLGKIFSHKDDVEEVFLLTEDEYKEQQKQYEAKRKAYSTAYDNARLYKRQLNDCVSKMDAVKRDYNKAKSNICPTCGQELHDNKVILALKDKAAKIKEQAVEYKKNLTAAEVALSRYDIQDIEDKLDMIRNQLVKIKQQNKYKQDYEKIEQELEEKNKRLIFVKDSLNSLDFELQQLNKLNKYFKTDFIQYIQKAFLNEIQNYLNLYCHDVFDEDFELKFSSNSLEIFVGGQPVSYYSGGEVQRINTMFLFAIKVALQTLTDKSTNLLILDEVLSGQDSEAFENCLELINNLTASEGLTTILVSHRDVDYQLNKIIIERYDDKTKLKIQEV